MSDEFADSAAAGGADPKLELILRYFDGDLNASELAEFNALLRSDPASRQRFAEYCTQSCLIRETFDPEKQALQRREPYRPAQARAHSNFRRWLTSAAAALFLVAAGGAAVWLLRSRPEQAAVIGTLEKLDGDVRVLSADGQTRPPAENMRVRSGDTIRTLGALSTAVLAYRDGTRLTLVGDAVITCSDAGQKSVVVHEGTLLASVVRQPESTPMLLSTPTALVEAWATNLVIETQPDQTDVKVTEGQASVVRSSDGKRIDVPAGKRMLTSRKSVPAPEDISNPPDTLRIDFAEGLPPAWARGKFVTEGLRPGVKGAVKAVPSARYENVFEIASRDMWFAGLFTVHDDSYISVTLKMERPDWINIFIQVRTISPGDPASINYLYNNLRFYQFKPGQWRTVRIPLSKFIRAGYATDKRLKEEVPCRLMFSSEGADRGLTVERIEIGRGALADVEYTDEQ